jgi:hypothetical protein
LLGETDDGNLQQAAALGGLDLVGFDQPSDPKSHLPSNWHYTREGHEEIAAQLYQAMMARLRGWGISDRERAAMGTQP